KAGYELVWMGEDYPVQKRVLSGEFEANDGPIKQLSEDYGPNSRVEKPLTFTFYKKTLVVENLKYEQRGAAQYIQPSESN
ncbi:MAG: hypothetical protein C0448_16025, partial [Sphingobacteriaceae bacterium]|nr:hypothetical protein [Sphingobacteriaceae bacterium]